MRCKLLLSSIIISLCCFRFYSYSQTHAYAFKENKPREQDNARSLKDALYQLEEKYKATFFYQSDIVEGLTIRETNENVEIKNLETELTHLLSPFDLFYKKGGDSFYVIINKKDHEKEIEKENSKSFIPSSNDSDFAYLANLSGAITRHSLALKLAEEITVKGKVTDSKGTPIPGVNVRVKDTNIGTTTDSDGNYTLVVSEGKGVLVFSYIGYTTEEFPIDGKSKIDMILEEDLEALQEVVVVGYGTMKKGSVTGAVANMNVERLEERPIARVDQALVGQIAGVSVKQTTGTPGKAFSIQVRGAGSITAGNEPLYVIDGFPLATASPNSAGNFASGNPLDNINPNDIESIQVLKDASAAAIYGSRAANGVVVITTKKGKSGKPTISFNAYTGFSEPNRKLKMLDGDQYIDRAIEVINAQWEASGAGRTASQTNAERAAILKLPAGQVNTSYMFDERWLEPGRPGIAYVNWQDLAFRQAAVQNYQLAGSGGNEFVKYYISANYGNQDGIVIGMNYTSYSARANIEVAASKKLKFGLNISPTYSVTKDPGVEGKDNILHQFTSLSPVQEASMGENVNAFDNAQYRWSASTNSPIAKLKNQIGETKRFRTLSTIYLDYELIKGLNFKTTVNFDNTDNNSKSFVPYTVAGTLLSRQTQPGVNSSGTYSGFRNQTFVNENTLTYNTHLKGGHDISVLGGFSYNSYKLDNVRLASTSGYNTNSFITLNGATGIAGPTGSYTRETKSVLLSYFGRLQYSFNNKYLFSASIRRDGSSRFGNNTKWGLFPSASVGWRVSSEKFMEPLDFLSDLKLRASWGKSGNNNIGDYSSMPELAFYNYVFGGNSPASATGQAPSRVENPNLTWEKSETINAGVDIGFFQNRIFASFDYYTKNNTDLLLNVPIPQVTGYTTALTNIGQVKNKGWEIELNTKNLTGAFQWSTSVNLSHNENKVVKLGPGATSIQIPSAFDIPHSILKIGEPMYSIYVVKQIGILTRSDIDNGAALFGKQTVGDPKYFDANGDGVIDANDRVIVGKPNPTYTWGFTNTFKFKGFDLTVLVQGQNGGSIYSLFGRAIDRTGMGNVDNAIASHADRWKSEENPGNGSKGKAYSTFGRIKNTDWLYSSDYWRLRNITLGYNLSNLIPSKYVSNSRIYLTAENYFGHDKYKGGYNPEAANTDLSGDANFPEPGDYGGLPLAKSLIIGLNLTF